MFGSVGWTAMSWRRPLTGESTEPAPVSVWPSGMVEGPIGTQEGSGRSACAAPPSPASRRGPTFLCIALRKALTRAPSGMRPAGNERWP